jgi:hypothetical protein
VSGVAGMPLPGGHPDLQPCGTLAAYRRHLRDGLRGTQIDRACRQAVARDWEDRAVAGYKRPRRRRQRSGHRTPREVCERCGEFQPHYCTVYRRRAGERSRAA